MSTTEIIGKHDVLCSSLNFATPGGVAKCDCNLSIMADMLEALEAALRAIRAMNQSWIAQGTTLEELARGGYYQTLRLQHSLAQQTVEAAINKARGIA